MNDPREEELPPVGLVDVRDAETGERRVIDASSRAVRVAWQGARRARVERLDATLRRFGIDSFDVRTDRPYDVPIMKFFKARERRARTA